MPPTAIREGVTAADVEAARRHRDEIEQRHDEQLGAAHTRLREMRDANGGTLPTNAETIAEVEALFAEADTTGQELDDARSHLARLQAQAFGTDSDDRMGAEEAQRRGHSPQAARGAGLPSLASRMFASEEWQRVAELAARSDNAADVFRRELHDIPLADADRTALLLSVAAAARGGVSTAAQFDGDPLVPDEQRIWAPLDLPTYQPAILDLLTVSTTGLDEIFYTVLVDETGNVTGQPPGQPFDEADILVERRQASIVDRGTTLPVPERNLEDEGRMRAFLDGRLQGFLRRDAENQVIAGDGLAENFRGIVNTPGVGTIERSAGDNLADGVHRGITQVRLRYFDEPNAIALRAEVWEDIVLEKDGQGRYVHSAGALSEIPTSLWGKRTAVAHALAAPPATPVAIVGQFREAEIVIRIGLQLREFEQHADFAKRRLVLLRALYRAAFIVNQPVAFSVVDLTEPI